MRSLYSAVGGLRNHQTRMDVIGNNIANVNTTGYKAGRASFQDIINQNLQGASAAQSGGRGGVNPMQVGLGMATSSIDNLFTNGSIQSTGVGTDLAISDDGFFILSDGTTDVYTRDGNFDFDNEGVLVSRSSGLKVQGWIDTAFLNPVGTTPGSIPVIPFPDYGKTGSSPLQELKIVKGGKYNTGNIGGVDENLTPTPPALPTQADVLNSVSINKAGQIIGTFASGVNGVLGQVALAKFNNPGGMNKLGSNTYTPSANSGTASVGAASTGGRGAITPGALEMSNVDLSQQFSDMIVTQRGFQSNSKIITVSDEMLETLVNMKR